MLKLEISGEQFTLPTYRNNTVLYCTKLYHSTGATYGVVHVELRKVNVDFVLDDIPATKSTPGIRI